MKTNTYDRLKEEFTKIIKQHRLETEDVIVKAVPLSPEEVIGNPEDRDYPLISGRERMIQAEFKGSPGQAFTDMYGNFNGKLSDIIGMDLTNNFRRAIYIATINAVLRHLGLINCTVHCKDNEPVQCGTEIAQYIETKYGNPKIAIAGLQPRMVQALSTRFEIKVTDLDTKNIGTEKFGVYIDGPGKTAENLEWCDIALVTGTTIVNNTFDQFRISKPVIFFGVTITGAAYLLGLDTVCYYGH
ncbi:MAG: DUF364 domain-containing protein [Dehalococcoidia bacterium]